MKRLDRVWNQKKLSTPTKLRIYSTCVLPVLLYGSETWTLHSMTGSVWTPSIRDVNDGYSTSAGAITSSTTKSCVAPVCSQPHSSSGNEDWAYSATSPDSQTMFQLTRSSGPAAKCKEVIGRHPAGNVLEADPQPHGFTRLVGTQESQ